MKEETDKYMFWTAGNDTVKVSLEAQGDTGLAKAVFTSKEKDREKKTEMNVPFLTEEGLLAFAMLVKSGAMKIRASARRNGRMDAPLFRFAAVQNGEKKQWLEADVSAKGYLFLLKEGEDETMASVEFGRLDAAVLSRRILSEHRAVRTSRVREGKKEISAAKGKGTPDRGEKVMIIYDSSGKLNDGRPVASRMSTAVKVFTRAVKKMTLNFGEYSKKAYTDAMNAVKDSRDGTYFVRFAKGEEENYLITVVGDLY